jgi:hypothetical protein
VLEREGSYTYSFKGGTDLTFTYTLPLLSRRNILSIRCPPNALGNLPKCFLCRTKLKATCFTRKGAMDIKLEYPEHADHIAHPGTLLICCQTLNPSATTILLWMQMYSFNQKRYAHPNWLTCIKAWHVT